MSKITKLVNPKTDFYYRLKEYVLSDEFVWFYFNESVSLDDDSTDNTKFINIPVYSHSIIGRSMIYDRDYPKTTINRNGFLVPVVLNHKILEQYVNPFLYDLLCANYGKDECYVRSILRLNFNATHSDLSGIGITHFDHPPDILPHKNMLVYFTDAGGDTIVGDEHHTPEEDDIIVFDSEIMHCQESPKNKRRVVMVMTFI